MGYWGTGFRIRISSDRPNKRLDIYRIYYKSCGGKFLRIGRFISSRGLFNDGDTLGSKGIESIIPATINFYKRECTPTEFIVKMKFC